MTHLFDKDWRPALVLNNENRGVRMPTELALDVARPNGKTFHESSQP